MKKIFLLFLFLFCACEKPMTQDEVIRAMQKCHDAGFEDRHIIDGWSLRTLSVECYSK